MFFFFYGELGELEYNAIVKSAFEKMMFEKLQSEGYCDINPLIGRPRTSKSEIENNLKRLDSPLAKVFAGKYATNTKELETIKNLKKKHQKINVLLMNTIILPLFILFFKCTNLLIRSLIV